MKNKLFLVMAPIVLAVVGVLVMLYSQTIVGDGIGTLVILAGGILGGKTALARKKPKAIIPLVLGLVILIVTGFVRFKGVIFLAAFGFALVALYYYLAYRNAHNKNT